MVEKPEAEKKKEELAKKRWIGRKGEDKTEYYMQTFHGT